MQGQLKSANVGDSGYMLLTLAPGGGRYELRYHTPQQEHSFGCPYQLGHYEGADAPEDAMLMTLPVRAAIVIAEALQLPQMGHCLLWFNTAHACGYGVGVGVDLMRYCRGAGATTSVMHR